MNNDDNKPRSNPADFAERLLARQLAMLAENADVALIGNLASILIYVLAVSGEFPTASLAAWAVVSILLLSIRYGCVLRYRRLRAGPVDDHRFRAVYYLGTVGSGLLWGWAGYFLLPSDPLSMAILVMIVAGLCASSTAVYASMKGLSACLVAFSAVPLGLGIMQHGNPLYVGLGGLILFFSLVIMLIAHRMYQSTIAGMRLLLENEDLAAFHYEAERELRNILDNMQDAVYRTDARGIITFVSNASGEMIGYTPEQLVGKPITELYVNPEARQELLERLQNDGYARNFIARLRHRDGHVIWASVNTRFYHDEQGEIAGVEGVVRDITPIKQAEDELRQSEEEYRRILDNMQDTYYRTDTEGRFVYLSRSVEELLGFPGEELIGQRLSERYVEPDGRERFIAALQAGGGVLRNYEAPLRRKDGSVVWVSTNAQYYRDRDGNIAGVEGTTRDVTALKQAEEALFQAQEHALVTLQSIGDGVITARPDGSVAYLNPVAEQLTGWGHEEARGRPLQEIFKVVEEETREQVPDLIRSCLREQKTIKVAGNPLLIGHHGDEERSVEITVSPLHDTRGECTGVVMVFHDVTELRGLARDMSYQATHDSLTGLINRAEFERRLSLTLQSFQYEPEAEHALMYLDLDQFKVVNDTCGHAAGDELLRQLTTHLCSRIRGSDVLARLGGDEFGVLLENCPLEEARRVADDLRRMTHEFRFHWQGKVFEIGVSIGLVPLQQGCGDLSLVLRQADSACYVAKEQGRNRVHVFHARDADVARHYGQMQWVPRIKEALARDRFALYCQRVSPVGRGRHQRGDYYEVLVRMLDESGAVVAPMQFIPAAERYRLMPDLDRWVVSHAMRMLAEHATGRNGNVYAINLSGQSLAEKEFLGFLIDELDASGLDPESICFEITETAAISNLIYATRLIDVLRGMGCLFALDDFGSGLSSFAYLKKLPVNYLKIDGHFIKDIPSDPRTYALVDGINRIGHNFGMETIAEFVQSDEILASLYRMGVDYAQGYAIARPAPIKDVLAAAHTEKTATA